MFDIEFIVPYQDLLSSVLEAYNEFPSRDEIKLHIRIMDNEEVKNHSFIGQAVVPAA